MTLERLGGSDEFGDELLAILRAHDWTTAAVYPAFAGDAAEPGERPKWLVIASRMGYEVRRTGADRREAIGQVFNEAARITRIQDADRFMQLRLPNVA